MHKNRKLIYGVGINDADYYVSHRDEKGKKISCPFYARWKRMLTRCYSEKFHVTNPTYVGCSVTEEWHGFSEFKDWMEKQSWEGMALDKDILVPGNRVYSPSTCVFVPRQLNQIFADARAARGAHPLGVSNRGNLYITTIKRNNSTVYLGCFSTAAEAHAAWQAAKIQFIKEVYAEWKNPEPRVGPAIDRIVAKLQDDLDNGRETISFLT